VAFHRPLLPLASIRRYSLESHLVAQFNDEFVKEAWLS